jgi:transposase
VPEVELGPRGFDLVIGDLPHRAFPAWSGSRWGDFRRPRYPSWLASPRCFTTRVRAPETSLVTPNEGPAKPTKPAEPTKSNKSRTRSLPVPVPVSAAALDVINPDAAGIDVHSDMHMVCVPADRDADPVRQFGANTADLQEIVAWLKECRARTIALESTGVYWIPLFELLESEGFEVNPVEPGPLSRCGARPKTDVLDARWIPRLHSYGLLRASFRPPDSVPAPRAYWRQRQMQVRYAASHVQPMQKAMEQMNVKLTEVVSDITGLTGMAIIAAIREGQRDPIPLARLRHERCPHSEEQIALALEGTWRPEHLFELRQAHELYQFHHRQITECDQQVRAELANFPNRAGEETRTVKPRERGRKSNDVRFEATGPLFRALGVDLTLIEGIDVGTALVILAEIGADVSRFPTEKPFASRLRLGPPPEESHKTKKRRGHRKGTNPATLALRMCARSLGKTKTPWGLFYRRIRSRIGGLGAVKATAHKLACLVYRMLKYGQEYVAQSMEEYEAKMEADVLKALKRRAAAMGFELSPLPTQ